MSTIASTSPTNRNSLLGSITLGGTIIALCHLIIQDGIFFSLLEKYPYISLLQYIARGAMGKAAFAGGLATALLGAVLEFLMTFIIAGIFILSAYRIPLLRRYVIVGSLLYGVGVFIVMNFIVLPLSAAPPSPLTVPQIIETFIDHILLIGLPLGILVRRNANANK
jgi:hypothetical protein